MKIFAAGWSLQKPDQNYFKRFIRLNDISIAGIVYPKRIPADIEGIPVLDFDEARGAVRPEDIVIDMSANRELKDQVDAFFGAQGITLVSVTDYLDRAIRDDEHDTLRLPVVGMKTSDIRSLKQAPRPTPFDAHFHDFESYELANKLDGIFRDATWQRLLEFDRDDTPGSVILTILLDLHRRGLVTHLRVLDAPRMFLDTILKLRLHDSKAAFTVSVSDRAMRELGGRAEFYRRSLADCTVPFEGGDAAPDDRSIVLTGSADAIVAAGAQGLLQSAICFMPRSIVDYLAVKHALGERRYRILLRQPDTVASNLVAAILTPALFGC